MCGSTATHDAPAEDATSAVRKTESQEGVAGRFDFVTHQDRKTRIALLTPYTGGNLGDAAIQDAVIANLRRQIPDVQFSGITLNCENFLKQHGTEAFPLVGLGIPFFQMDEKWVPEERRQKSSFPGSRRIRGILRHLPGAKASKQGLERIWSLLRRFRRETRHWAEGYRFLRTHDLLIFSGGGQLDDNYGGPWGLPYALFKWAVIARLARVPSAMASVGVGLINSALSRRLLSVALSLCAYRSFRESRSRDAAALLNRCSRGDQVVPDLALSLTDSELPPIDGTIREKANGHPIVALSPMAFAKPVNWPAPDRALHDRYVREMARVLSELCSRGYFVVIACSSRGDDESVIPVILEHLDEGARDSFERQLHFPKIENWKQLVSVLQTADYLIASRLHGAIFGFLTETPVIAISFASKVDWILEYLRMSAHRLDIRDFTAENVLSIIDHIAANGAEIVKQIASHRRVVVSDAVSAKQYTSLADLALAHRRAGD